MTTIHRISCPIPYPLQTANCYFIPGAQPTLIDTGAHAPDSFAAIEKGVRKTGHLLSDIRRIILTHAHTDHMGQAGNISKVSGATVFVHPWDLPKLVSVHPEHIQRHLFLFSRFMASMGVPESIITAAAELARQRLMSTAASEGRVETVVHGEIFVFDDFKLRVVHTPGHSAGSICLFDEENGRLFSGDTVLEHVASNVMAEFNLPEEVHRYTGMTYLMESLKKIDRLQIGPMLPGHGQPFGNGKQRLAGMLGQVLRKKRIVHQLIRRTAGRDSARIGTTLYQLARKMFPNLKGQEVFWGLSEIYSFIQVLAEEGAIELWQENMVHRVRPRDSIGNGSKERRRS